MSSIALIRRATDHGDAVAIFSPAGEHSYRDILDSSARLASFLLEQTSDLEEARVAYLLPAGFDYVSTQWGIWRAGGIAVPLSLSATEPELEYTLTDSAVSQLVTSRDLVDKVSGLAERIGLRLLVVEDTKHELVALPDVGEDRRAMILYTSGTTSKPKGVVSTHANIRAQITALIEAWHWETSDSIPLFLPLHHIHGIINIMSSALWIGAKFEPFERFKVEEITDRVSQNAYSVFMAVPTIYVIMIQWLDLLSDAEREPIVTAFGKMRLMISGSAALPSSVHEAWTGLTGQRLLERYGMTEIGMGLSNPYGGERRAGMVGQPLPNVNVRLKSEQGHIVAEESEPGEIQIRGPAVFLEYWRRPEVTRNSYDDGWFRTGDMAVLEDGYYRIMGRQSVDIIKSGGYKLSALEIEAALMDHDAIQECAVVGTPDETWGEAVAVAVVLAEKTELQLEELRDWCRDRLSKYKIPKELLVVDSLPRNAMGKVTKPAVSKLFSK